MSVGVPLVLDASAIIAWSDKEDGWGTVEKLLLENPGRLFIHGLNAAEVMSHFHRKRADGMAYITDRMDAVGLTIVEDLDAAFREDVARLKGDHRRVSLADCCLLALARRLQGEAITTDHGEMDVLVGKVLCPIRFIR